jgi:hypothetical protein
MARESLSIPIAPMPHDRNELDRAIFALGKSKSALPDIFRALSRGKLCALMPSHPDQFDRD